MISFEHVSKTYPNGVKGLADINLTIGDGEFVSIIGLSGAGKSTLLRSINRLIDITEGEILVNGVSVTKAGKKQLPYRHDLPEIQAGYTVLGAENRHFRADGILFHLVEPSGAFHQGGL